MNWQQLDSLSYQSRLRDLPPAHKLLFGSVMLLLVLVGHAFVQLLVFLWMGVWVVRYARIPLRSHLLFLLLPLSFFVAGLPALLVDLTEKQAGSLPADALICWDMGPYVLYIASASLTRALELFYRIAASLSCFSFLLFTVPFVEILQVLRRIGLPELVTELLMIMYRFIFVLLKTSSQLWVAQRSRGGHQGFRALLRDVSMVAAQLFVRTMGRYQSLSMGMAARGWADSFSIQSLRTHTRSVRHEWESILGGTVLVLLECLTGGWQF